MSTWFFWLRDFAVILVGHRRKTFLLFLFENYVLSIIQFKCTIIRTKLKDPNWKPNIVKTWIMVLRRDRNVDFIALTFITKELSLTAEYSATDLHLIE